jgi:hypothetical protein
MLGSLRRCSLMFLIIGEVLCSSECRADTASEAQAEAAKIASVLVLPLPDGKSMGLRYREAMYGVEAAANYLQYSEFKWTVIEEPLSAADRLNGLTWKGTITWTMAAYRDLSENSYSARCWRPWRDLSPSSSPKWSLQKVRDQWQNTFLGSDSMVGNKLPTQADAERVLRAPLCTP